MYTKLVILMRGEEECSISVRFFLSFLFGQDSILILRGAIAGSTHPSFSDIFLLLPSALFSKRLSSSLNLLLSLTLFFHADFINRRLGLTTEPEKVLELTVNTTIEFLEGRLKKFNVKNEDGLERHDPPYRDDVAVESK